MFGMMDSFMFNVFPVIFFVILVLFIAFFVFTISKGVKEKVKNDNSPVLTVEAKAVAKRVCVDNHVNRDVGDNNISRMSSSTDYFVTFEFESKDRMELIVAGTDYGMIVEGDVGKLTFQGTRFLSFKRI